MAARLYDAGGLGGLEADGDPERMDLDAYRARMALQHAMQAGHTSLEIGLRCILEMLAEDPPTGPRRHEDLIRRVSRPLSMPGLERPAILSREISLDATETGRFRYLAMHEYDILDLERAAASIEAARRLSENLPTCIERFRAEVDPPSAAPGCR
jgi:hypothetical protein